MNKVLRDKKKRPVAILGETRPACPDKGCVGEEPGKVTTHRCNQGLALTMARRGLTYAELSIAGCQSEDKNARY